LAAINDADGNVAQVTPDGRLQVEVGGNVIVNATEYVARVDGTRINPATQETLAALAAEDFATEATLAALRSDRDFSRILKFEPLPTEEIRRDETLTDDYHGVAPDGSATSALVWSVVRFYKTAGLITRVRYRTGISWDNRAVGW